VKPLIGFSLPSSQRLNSFKYFKTVSKRKINISVIFASRAKDVEHPAAGGENFLDSKKHLK